MLGWSCLRCLPFLGLCGSHWVLRKMLLTLCPERLCVDGIPITIMCKPNKKHGVAAFFIYCVVPTLDSKILDVSIRKMNEEEHQTKFKKVPPWFPLFRVPMAFYIFWQWNKGILFLQNMKEINENSMKVKIFPCVLPYILT